MATMSLQVMDGFRMINEKLCNPGCWLWGDKGENDGVGSGEFKVLEKVWLSPGLGPREFDWYQGGTIISGKNEQGQLP